MSPKAKPSPKGYPKPHYLAHVADFPCTKCGYDWVRPASDLSNLDVEEIELFDVCANCGTRPFNASVAAPRLTSEERPK